MELVLLKLLDEGLLGAVDGDVLELEVILGAGHDGKAQYRKKEDNLFHSGRIIGYYVTNI